MPVLSLTRFIVAGSLMAALGVAGIFLGTNQANAEAEMRLFAGAHLVEVGQTFTVAVIVASTVPTNVFAGSVAFDPTLLQVEAIEFQSSMVDLWAKEPVLAPESGTISFVGGTTQPGGFTGSSTILSITFSSVKRGQKPIVLSDVRILQHDGLGTQAQVTDPLETLISIQSATRADEVVPLPLNTIAEDTWDLAVADPVYNADLNGDGKITLRDTSIFMQHLATQNLRSDFNDDGQVGLSDYSIFTQLQE